MRQGPVTVVRLFRTHYVPCEKSKQPRHPSIEWVYDLACRRSNRKGGAVVIVFHAQPASMKNNHYRDRTLTHRRSYMPLLTRNFKLTLSNLLVGNDKTAVSKRFSEFLNTNCQNDLYIFHELNDESLIIRYVWVFN